MTSIALVLTAGTGAVGRHVGAMARIFAERGHAVDLYCLPELARGHNFAAMEGVVVRPLRELIHARRADVIHAFGYQATLQVAPFAFGTPLVSSWHQAAQPPAGTAATRWIQAAAARTADLVLGASGDLVAEAHGLGVRAELGPISIASPPSPSASREQLRADLALGPEDKLIVSVGRLTRLKNFDLVVDIANELSDRDDLRFVILGSGGERTRLLQRIVDPGLPVALLGTRGRVADLLAAADMVLITSKWEARPVLAQLALEVGVPLVATRVGGIPELVGDAAVLIDVEAPASAAFAITNLFDDDVRRAELVAKGHRQAATWPNEQQVADTLLGWYRELISQQAGESRSDESRNRG